MQEHLRAQPGLLQEILKSLFEVILFEENSNQWSLSRPMLSLILINEPTYLAVRTDFGLLCCEVAGNWILSVADALRCGFRGAQLRAGCFESGKGLGRAHACDVGLTVAMLKMMPGSSPLQQLTQCGSLCILLSAHHRATAPTQPSACALTLPFFAAFLLPADSPADHCAAAPGQAGPPGHLPRQAHG